MNNVSFKILRELRIVSNSTPRDVAKACHLSLAKTNKHFQALIEEGFLDANYGLTDTAYNLLEQCRVDNAIIMAAGFGSRFVPLTYESPKGLLEVFGERMVERQIKQLIEASISDITIVVGYLKEKFEYLIDKYGVKLVYSPDYATKNNLSTLYLVRHLLKNTYILSSDNYMTENLYHSYESESWYNSIKANGDTPEWCLMTDKKDRIKKIKIGGHNEWHMYGPVYFTKSFSDAIVPLIEHTYHQPGTDNFFWEDVLRLHIDTLEMYINRQPPNTVYEFENLEELRMFDQTYNESSHNEVMCIIASIFHVKEDHIKEIKHLKIGMTNKSFVFKVNDKKYICRVPGEGTEKLINREAEYLCYQAVIPLGITENIVFIDPKIGVKISEFEYDTRPADINNPEEIQRCISIIKKLHNSGIMVPHTFDIEKEIFFYESLCRSQNAIHFEDYSLVSIKMSELLTMLKSMVIPSVFCHIDPVCDNFLILPNGDIKLIDWEYAAMCDPLIDIAMFAIYSKFDPSQLETLIEYYFENGPSNDERLRIYIYVALGGFLWSLWGGYKQSLGVSFGDYTLLMYRYAKTYYLKAMESVNSSK